jgi:hypothetical protein
VDLLHSNRQREGQDPTVFISHKMETEKLQVRFLNRLSYYYITRLVHLFCLAFKVILIIYLWLILDSDKENLAPSRGATGARGRPAKGEASTWLSNLLPTPKGEEGEEELRRSPSPTPPPNRNLTSVQVWIWDLRSYVTLSTSQVF